MKKADRKFTADQADRLIEHAQIVTQALTSDDIRLVRHALCDSIRMRAELEGTPEQLRLLEKVNALNDESVIEAVGLVGKLDSKPIQMITAILLAQIVVFLATVLLSQ